ncbi:unnamed protein product [Dibothriocephalus latus]|uniref:Uncharacterized protein n=1 Tax=Dibothriocephalus latus TaxID=60516 RepID=A0A3P6QQH8_DIBLA|nr:unnamed protein product [Dibothriocephalus latus]
MPPPHPPPPPLYTPLCLPVSLSAFILLDGFSSGFFLGCIVMLPFIIVTIVVAILYRKKLAQKAWVAGGLSTPPPDTIKLLDSNQPRYDA